MPQGGASARQLALVGIGVPPDGAGIPPPTAPVAADAVAPRMVKPATAAAQSARVMVPRIRRILPGPCWNPVAERAAKRSRLPASPGPATRPFVALVHC